MRRVIPFKRKKPPGVLLEAGGPVDSFVVSLCFHGEELDPDELTTKLGVSPSRSGRRGSRLGERSPPLRLGFWCLRKEAKAPVTPAEVLEGLLAQLPTSDRTWRVLSERFSVSVSIGIFLEDWNRGFDLSNDLITRVAMIGASFGCDIYAPDDA